MNYKVIKITDLKKQVTIAEKCKECGGEIVNNFPVIMQLNGSFSAFFPCRDCGILQGAETFKWDWSKKKIVQLLS